MQPDRKEFFMVCLWRLHPTAYARGLPKVLCQWGLGRAACNRNQTAVASASLRCQLRAGVATGGSQLEHMLLPTPSSPFLPCAWHPHGCKMAAWTSSYCIYLPDKERVRGEDIKYLPAVFGLVHLEAYLSLSTWLSFPLLGDTTFWPVMILERMFLFF